MKRRHRHLGRAHQVEIVLLDSVNVDRVRREEACAVHRLLPHENRWSIAIWPFKRRAQARTDIAQFQQGEVADAIDEARTGDLGAACSVEVLLGDLQDQPRLFADLADLLVPVVGLWQGSSPLEVPTVDVDNKAGIRAGLDHLVDLGHDRIAFVSGRPLGDIRERQAAFTEYMVGRFGGVPDGYIQHVSNTPGGGETAMNALLALDPRPTAIVTSTDTLAVGALHAAYSRGVVVPRDLSVVGFDDILLASHTVPALTTLRMPTAEIVTEGVRLALESARDPSARRVPKVAVMAPSLIVRQSTAPPPART